MRRFYMVSGILLILHTIDFAVAAPMPVQKRPQVDVNVVHMLGKRGGGLGKLNELLDEYFGDLEDHFAAEPPSSSSPPGPADGWTDLKQPLSSIPEEPSLM